ncbi:MAG: SRPBCC domain-containing protein [Planctomycetota bacterium]
MRIIRKEVFIEAPVARVWEHVTDPAKIAGWLMPNDFEARLGKGFTLDCDEEGKIACVVLEIVPQQRLVYSFTSHAIKITTTVTITLAADRGGTRLTLVHSGWEALPPSEQGIGDAFEHGWVARLQSLRAQVKMATGT